MDKRLQEVAVQLVTVVVTSNLNKNISCSVNISSGYSEFLDLAINMWDTDKTKIVKHKSYEFRNRDTDLTIAKKLVEIINVINREIDLFEEENDERN